MSAMRRASRHRRGARITPALVHRHFFGDRVWPIERIVEPLRREVIDSPQQHQSGGVGLLRVSQRAHQKSTSKYRLEGILRRLKDAAEPDTSAAVDALDWESPDDIFSFIDNEL